jgi:hypothetical protein
MCGIEQTTDSSRDPMPRRNQKRGTVCISAAAPGGTIANIGVHGTAATEFFHTIKMTAIRTRP